MWYIFNENSKCVGTADQNPDMDDLIARKEIAIESNLVIDLNKIIMDGAGNICTPLPPTKEEITQQKLSILDIDYNLKFTELSQSISMALLSDNSALITSIKAEYAALKAEYDAKRGEIIG